MKRTKLVANPTMINMWAKRDKCWMCKKKFDRPVLLPVVEPKPGVLQPNINVEVSYHIMETHGMPTIDYVHNYVFNSIYDIENTMENLYGTNRMIKILNDRGMDE